jgi:hypothetical protein
MPKQDECLLTALMRACGVGASSDFTEERLGVVRFLLARGAKADLTVRRDGFYNEEHPHTAVHLLISSASRIKNKTEANSANILAAMEAILEHIPEEKKADFLGQRTIALPKRSAPRPCSGRATLRLPQRAAAVLPQHHGQAEWPRRASGITSGRDREEHQSALYPMNACEHSTKFT